MKLRPALLILSFLGMSLVNAMSKEQYLGLCGAKERLSHQGRHICQAHLSRVNPGTSQSHKNESTSATRDQSLTYDSSRTKTQGNKAPAPKRSVSAQHPQKDLTSRERRERLQFKPYTPGAFSIVKKEEDNEG